MKKKIKSKPPKTESIFLDAPHTPRDVMFSHSRQSWPTGDVAPWQQEQDVEREFEQQQYADELSSKKEIAMNWLHDRMESMTEQELVLLSAVEHNANLANIARQWGVTGQAVRQMRDRFMKRLRKDAVKAGVTISGLNI